MRKKTKIVIISTLALLLIACLFVPSIVDVIKNKNDNIEIEKDEDDTIENNNDNENNEQSKDENISNEKNEEDETDNNNEVDAEKDDSSKTNGNDEDESLNENQDDEEDNDDGHSESQNDSSKNKIIMLFEKKDLSQMSAPRIDVNTCSILTEEYEDVKTAERAAFTIKTKTTITELVDGDAFELQKLIEPKMIQMCEKKIGEKVTCEYYNIQKIDAKSGDSTFVIYGKMIGSTQTRPFTVWYNVGLDDAYEYKHISCMGLVDQTGKEDFFKLIMATAITELQNFNGEDEWHWPTN